MTAVVERAVSTAEAAAAVAASKPRRVRTGCLTCRERHLKCDEGLPHCQNCRKSSRVCKRGVRLNFIDTQVKSPPMLPPTADWKVQFQDESREIASEYRGGLSRYTNLEQPTQPLEQQTDYSSRVMPIDPQMTPHHPSPLSIQPGAPGLYPESHLLSTPDHLVRSLSDGTHRARQNSSHHSHTNSDASYLPTAPSTSYGPPEQALTPPNEHREYLNSPEEVLFMQVFVEEVGLWMDSMDSMKHFSRLLPFHALGEPMLLNAFLACGARHLTLVNPAYHEDKALYYYDTATRQLLRALQNPERDTVVCATTAVILNVYEIMSERATQRMNHIAGARALIKECRWDARSTGIGAACFWLNVGMEILSCIHFNWQTAWAPEQWGLDMDFSREDQVGREELWVHRMLYIIAKVNNFRATIPRFQEPNQMEEQSRLRSRYAEWESLKELCERWDNAIPRTMHPLAYLYPHQTTSKSRFPEVWLVKRATIIGRLFYHTALTLLAQINPLVPVTDPSMSQMQFSNAHQICGITAHVKDRGVASVALRSMAVAAECLVDHREQEEVINILEKITKETGWQIGFLFTELKAKWGWSREEPDTPASQQSMTYGNTNQPSSASSNGGFGTTGPPSSTVFNFPPISASSAPNIGIPSIGVSSSSLSSLPPPPSRGLGMGGVNPMYRTADFSLPNHPYQSHYQPPTSKAATNNSGIGIGSGNGRATGGGGNRHWY